MSSHPAVAVANALVRRVDWAGEQGAALAADETTLGKLFTPMCLLSRQAVCDDNGTGGESWVYRGTRRDALAAC